MQDSPHESGLLDPNRLDDHSLARAVRGERSFRPGWHAGDGINHVHALGDLAEDGVAEIADAVVKDVLVLEVDKKLRGGRIHRRGAGHGQRAPLVLQAVCSLVLDGRAGKLLGEFLVETTALDHEVPDHPVEDRPVVVFGLGVPDEVLDRDGCPVPEENSIDHALVGLDYDGRVALALVSGNRQARDQKHRQ